MNKVERLIKLVEVYSDIAGRRKGASLGIQALKQSGEDRDSQYFKTFLSEAIEDENNASKEESRFKRAKYIDKVSLVIERLANRIKQLRQQGLFPIVLAGDHASCAGTMHGLKMAHGEDEIGVIYIDAHADLHSPYSSDSGNMHGMPLAIACALDNENYGTYTPTPEEKHYWHRLKFMASSERSIKPENIIFCAIRDCESSEEQLIKEHNISVHSVADITYHGIEKTISMIFNKLAHCQHIYVSFDVDSVDPLYIPGTGTPVKNGLSYEQALQLNLGLIENSKVCCWEMAEINPLYNNSVEDSEKIFHILEKVTDRLVHTY